MLDGIDRPEDLPPALVALRREWIDAGGHGGLRHDYTEAGEQAQRDRCTRGHDPITGRRTDWENGREHKYGRDASALATPAALVFAEAKLWRDPTAAQKRVAAEQDGSLYYPIKVAAAAIFGVRFADYLRGYQRNGTKRNPDGSSPISFPPDTQIFAIYRRDADNRPWYLYTIYPWRPSS